mmetsp:Transcript_22390/g.27542  ORF Transcript_22390/g.27542 Transcript_22390/m.27542 type:complete len:80 (-) Transcript_22390:1378-1617(-)
MMQTKTNEQKLRVIRSNKRESVGSIERVPAPIVEQSTQIGIMSQTMKDYYPAKGARTGTSNQARRHMYATGSKFAPKDT